LTFEPKSRLNLADGGNGNSLPDKRLNILLNCGQLNALWEGQEATDNLLSLIFHHLSQVAQKG